MMLPKLFVVGLLSTLALPVALAQGLGSLPPCAATCVAEVAMARNCILVTPQCICPGQLDIHNCISRSCQIEDLGEANTIVNSFCANPTTSSTTTSTSPSPPPPPPLPRPNPRTTSTGPTFAPPITIVTVTTGQPSLPAPQPSISSILSNITSTSPTASTTPSSLVLPTTTPPPTPLSTSSSPQTVVVFSTQFAPPSSLTGSASSIHDSVLVLLVSVIVSGIVGILIL